MQATCPKCDYSVVATTVDDLIDTVAADGGIVSLPERDVFCPGCETPLEFTHDRRD